jgi:hypothetical protein
VKVAEKTSVRPNTRFAGFGDRARVIGREARRRGFAVAAVAALLTLVASAPVEAVGVSQASLASGTLAGRAGASGPGLANVAVLDVVMLVDESGSETPAKVADEKQTVGTIVQSMLNPRSRVTVVGFGGVDHVVPNQDPVDVVCPPTIASGAAHLSLLASCVSKLHRRTRAEGNYTDYAAALGQAMTYFNPNTTYGQQSPANAIKVVLMMTDGAVDVSADTQQYGINWRQGEQQAINQQLAAARTYGVQVWPLGFGTEIGSGLTEPQALTYLNSIARHGAPAVCGGRRTTAQPHAIWVNNPANAISALDQLYADAGCLGSNGTHGTLPGGQSRTLTVTIPPIASDAAISVDRGNPSVQVAFTMPDGKPWTDSSAISGQDTSPVEVLHLANITNGEVGTWHIQLTAPPKLTSQLVSANVFWQGAVRAVITADPPEARLGQPVTVTLSVLGAQGPITDPAALKSLLVGVTVAGDGLPGPTQVRVTNAGESASSPTGVGDYAGTFTAPNRRGTLTFTGTAAGYGLYATQVPASVTVGRTTAGFNAGVQLPIVTSVQAGNSISGRVVFTNQTGIAKQVRLELTTSGAHASISPSGPITVRSGNPPGVPFTVSFNKDSPAGSAWMRVRVVDAANPSLAYSQEATTVTVTQPPGFLAKYLWYIVGLIVVIILAVLAVLWRRRVIRARKDVRGLVAILRQNGEQQGREFSAPARWSDVFRFSIRDETEPTAHLDFPQAGISEYQVRRSRPGEVKLMTPAGGEPYDVVVGGPGETMDHNGLELAFRDIHRLRGGRGGSGGRRDAGRRTPKPEPTPPSSGPGPMSTIPSAPPAPKDEWL